MAENIRQRRIRGYTVEEIHEIRDSIQAHTETENQQINLLRDLGIMDLIHNGTAEYVRSMIDARVSALIEKDEWK